MEELSGQMQLCVRRQGGQEATHLYDFAAVLLLNVQKEAEKLN